MFNKRLTMEELIENGEGTYTKNFPQLDIEICEIDETCIRYRFGKNYSQQLCECSNKDLILAYINNKNYGEFYRTTN
jgi:hypothetical protein